MDVLQHKHLVKFYPFFISPKFSARMGYFQGGRRSHNEQLQLSLWMFSFPLPQAELPPNRNPRLEK